MLAVVQSATLTGVQGQRVLVEVHAQSGGLPGFTIVGLPDAACGESRDRVRAALLSTGFDWPQRRITVNLAPSDVRKSGAGLDLAIAVGLLAAVELVPVEAVADIGFLGELGLDGSIRPVRGALPLADAIPASRLVVPPACAREAALLAPDRVHPVASLSELLACLEEHEPWPAGPPATARGPPRRRRLGW